MTAMPGDNIHKLSFEDILLLNGERPRFVKIAQRYVGKSELAEDIFQDCMVKILAHRDELEVGDIRGYFLIMVKNRCLDHLKSRLNRDSLPPELRELALEDMKLLTGECGNDFSLHVDFPVLLDKVRRLLPELTYEIFTAKRLSGMSAKEIARQFGVTERRVNFEIQKAQKVFRQVFRDYFVLFVLAVMSS